MIWKVTLGTDQHPVAGSVDTIVLVDKLVTDRTPEPPSEAQPFTGTDKTCAPDKESRNVGNPPTVEAGAVKSMPIGIVVVVV